MCAREMLLLGVALSCDGKLSLKTPRKAKLVLKTCSPVTGVSISHFFFTSRVLLRLEPSLISVNNKEP